MLASPASAPTTTDDVLIAGGGICGLVTALTLHQLGIPCRVFEAVSAPRPLGVGINLQPNAVRELNDLGIDDALLDTIGIQVREWALVGLNGNDIYAEPRGLLAGYHWPQYAVHRGELHMLLYRTVLERLGPDRVSLRHRAQGYRIEDDGSGVSLLVQTPGSDDLTAIGGKLLLGADGLHSAIRAQMHPDQPPIHWGGTIMWRGVTRAPAIRTGSSFVGLGEEDRRLVIYPISQPDADGLSLINWIAEIRVDSQQGWERTGWYNEVEVDSFLHHFEVMKYDWLDVPAMLAQCSVVFENPMIDRDPIDTWNDGPVLLMGDAAHPMYPTGSNGASQAIIDARRLGALFLEQGVNAGALAAFDLALNGPVNEVVLRNRGDGPFALLKLVEERCGGRFEDIDAVIPAEERQQFMQRYQAAAGFARDTLNAALPTITPKPA
ncbi:MAG: flavin-dependent oxidoreductase [Pseudomonadota bacterium]|nr:flavin-dependent oxidoreductase [Pseudomonadota bacterium]